MPSSSYVVSAEWLSENLDDEGVRIVDVRKRDDYDQAHVVKAASLPLSDVIRDEDPRAISRLAETIGIEEGTLVVAYDDQAGTYAARAAWALERIGHTRIALLATPFGRWRSLGFPVSRDLTNFNPTNYEPRERSDLAADVEYVKSRIGKESTVIVDTRDRIGYLDGHIPGAKTIPWRTFGVEDAVLRDADSLRRFIGEHGIPLDSEVITYCDAGITAALGFYAFRIAGFELVRLYPGSFMEWAASGLPIERIELAYYRDLL